MRSYELHVMKGGKWTIDAVFDDREFAVLEAKRVEANRRCEMLRVIEELYDEERHQSQTRTIFSGGWASEPAAPKPERTVSAGPAPRQAARPRTPARPKQAPQKKPPSYSGIAVKLVILMVAGLAALYGVWHLFHVA